MPLVSSLGQAIGPLWDFCAPISIIVAVLQYTTIIKVGAQSAQRSLFAQPNLA